MKIKFLLFSLFLLPLCATEPLLSAKNETEKVRSPQKELSCNEFLPASFYLQLRLAYLYPTNHQFRTFYSGGVVWGPQFDWQFADQFCWWTSVECFFKKGETSLGNPTKLTLVPLASGVKWIYPNYHWVQPYIGVGIEALYLRETIKNSTLLLRSVHDWDFGFRFKVGFLTRFSELFFIDVYADSFVKCARLYNTSSDLVTIARPVVNYLNFGAAAGFSF